MMMEPTMTTLATSVWRPPLVRSSSAGFLEAEAPLRPPDLTIVIVIVIISISIIFIVNVIIIILNIIRHYGQLEISINKDLTVTPHGASSDDWEDILGPWGKEKVKRDQIG